MNVFELLDVVKPWQEFHRKNDSRIFMITDNQRLVLKTGRFTWEWTDNVKLSMEDEHASDWNISK